MTQWNYAVPLAPKSEITIYDPAAATDTVNGSSPGCSSIPNVGTTTGIALFWNTIVHEQVHVQQISTADPLVAVAPGTPWENGWSWNQVPNDNHWDIGIDGIPGRPTVDDDGDGTIDNLINTGPGELGNISDDVQEVPIGQGQPNQTCVTAGSNGTLETIPGGDDTIAGTSITTGPDGICQSSIDEDDVQTIPVGQGEPNRLCVTPGPNGQLESTPVGDDIVVGGIILTGADGICDSTAGPQNPSDDVDLDTVAPLEDWPDAWGPVPPPPYCGGWAVEHLAHLGEPNNNSLFARDDWGDPGKNHRTIDKHDD